MVPPYRPYTAPGRVSHRLCCRLRRQGFRVESRHTPGVQAQTQCIAAHCRLHCSARLPWWHTKAAFGGPRSSGSTPSSTYVAATCGSTCHVGNLQVAVLCASGTGSPPLKSQPTKGHCTQKLPIAAQLQARKSAWRGEVPRLTSQNATSMNSLRHIYICTGNCQRRPELSNLMH
jgi:hypothetical protein